MSSDPASESRHTYLLGSAYAGMCGGMPDELRRDGYTAEESRLEERSQAEESRIACAELDSIAVLTAKTGLTGRGLQQICFLVIRNYEN